MITKEQLWNDYFDMVYDSNSVPEEDYPELELEFYKALESGNVNNLIFNLENIINNCQNLIDELKKI